MKNLWLKVIICYLLIHPFLVPPLEWPTATDQLISNLWQYKPMFYVFLYYLLFTSLQSMPWMERNKECVAKTIMWVGLIVAMYLIIQYFGLDNRQNLMGVYIWQAPRPASDRLSSFLTHPNYSSAFIAMSLPFVIYFRRWVLFALMTIAVFLSESDFSIGAMGLGFIIYFWLKQKNKLLWSLVFVLIGSLLFCLMPMESLRLLIAKVLYSSNGRFHIWFLMWQDLKQSSLFGFGFGSFPILFQSLHRNTLFGEAHNEFWQFCYETGIVGGILLIALVGDFLKKSYGQLKNEISIAFLCAFATILITSFGYFMFQIEPSRFYAVVLAAIISSKTQEE